MLITRQTAVSALDGLPMEDGEYNVFPVNYKKNIFGKK